MCFPACVINGVLLMLVCCFFSVFEVSLFYLMLLGFAVVCECACFVRVECLIVCCCVFVLVFSDFDVFFLQ